MRQVIGDQTARDPAAPPLAGGMDGVLALALLAGAVTSLRPEYPGSPWGSLASPAGPRLAVMFAAGFAARLLPGLTCSQAC